MPFDVVQRDIKNMQKALVTLEERLYDAENETEAYSYADGNFDAKIAGLIS